MDYASLIDSQRAFFNTGQTRPLHYRLAQLKSLHDALQMHESSLCDALHADLHKSPAMTYTTEIAVVLSHIQHARKHVKKWMKPERQRSSLFTFPSRAAVHAEPLGIALIFSPWNYPIQLLLSPLVGAIAAGCCAILKPSELAAKTSAALAKLIAATFSPSHIAVVEGDSTVAQSLLDEKVDTIFFTGSPAVGKQVMTAAARNLTPLTLELGGKSPAIICADADIDITARRIAWGKFLNAGQTCVAPDYCLVDAKIYDRFLAALKQSVLDQHGAIPKDSPDYSRIINAKNFSRLAAYLDRAAILHGGDHDSTSLYFSPTIIENPAPDSPVTQEEIFGPILPIIPFAALSDALASLSEKATPLALYLFTRSREIQSQILAHTRSGGVCINDTIFHIVPGNLPFGGRGNSGFGAYHGKSSFDAFSQKRSVLTRSFRFDIRFRYPPLNTPLKTIKRVYRYLLGT
jgi:aldehyde dehydrogenase (NAD+)